MLSSEGLCKAALHYIILPKSLILHVTADGLRYLYSDPMLPMAPSIYPRCIPYADDYFVLTGNAGDCQIMADTCRSQSLKWRCVSNLGVEKKNAIADFEPKMAPNVPVMWGNKIITVQNNYRSLRVTFSSSGKWDAYLTKFHISV